MKPKSVLHQHRKYIVEKRSVQPMKTWLKCYYQKLRQPWDVPPLVRWSLFWGWLAIFSMNTYVEVSDFLRGGGSEFWKPLFWESTSALVILILFRLQRPFLFDFELHKSPWAWFAQQFVVLPLYCLLFVAIVFGIRHSVFQVMGLTYSHRPWGELFLYESIKVAGFAVLAYTVIFGIMSFLQLRREEEAKRLSEKLLQEARLHNLTAQLQPHFLFNALNTISALMYQDLAKADSAIASLGDLLRLSISHSAKPLIPLEHELAMVDSYLDLMRLRFEQRLEVKRQIVPASLGVLIPPLTLQGLVENSIKHGVEASTTLTTISLSVECFETGIRLVVQDDGATKSGASSGGTGLANLALRLEQQFGNKAQFKHYALQPQGYFNEVILL